MGEIGNYNIDRSSSSCNSGATVNLEDSKRRGNFKICRGLMFISKDKLSHADDDNLVLFDNNHEV